MIFDNPSVLRKLIFSTTIMYHNLYLYNFIFFLLLVLLILASQRIETVFAEWLDSDFLEQYFSEDVTTKRGSMPSLVEWAILAWVAGKIP